MPAVPSHTSLAESSRCKPLVLALASAASSSAAASRELLVRCPLRSAASCNRSSPISGTAERRFLSVWYAGDCGRSTADAPIARSAPPPQGHKRGRKKGAGGEERSCCSTSSRRWFCFCLPEGGGRATRRAVLSDRSVRGTAPTSPKSQTVGRARPRAHGLALIGRQIIEQLDCAPTLGRGSQRRLSSREEAVVE